MYRSVCYSLFFLYFFAILSSILGFLSYQPITLVVSLSLLIIVSYFSNLLFGKLYRVSPNIESQYITSLILFFLFNPATTKTEYLTLIVATVLATASKYLFKMNNHHLFNPAAIGAILTPLLGLDGAIWWVATPSLFAPLLVIFVYLITKLRRQKLAIFYFAGIMLGVIVSKQLTSQNFLELITEMIVSWPLFFFASIMLTEPLTMPNRQKTQSIYGFLIGFLFTQKFSLGPIYNSPEFSLILGNIYAFLVSSKARYSLKLIKTVKIANSIYESTFVKPKNFNFEPGQYLEWQLPHPNSDTRGIRRYFTISSSPTENDLKLVYKIFPDSSSFKKSLINLKTNSNVSVTSASGDFLLPSNLQSLVFIAGGIGITPFRSHLKYLLDNNKKANIDLLYISSNSSDFVYQDLFDSAKSIGLNTKYFDTSKNQKITIETIKKLSNYHEKSYYISGPEPMVQHYKKLLNSLGITKIKTDYFPGF